MAMEVSDVDRSQEPMEGKIKQVDKRANSNGQATNPRIIIDASYIRGMKKDGAPLRTICEQGGRIMLIDTLVRELITSDQNQWSLAIPRLVEYRDSIEICEHVSKMCKAELEDHSPYGDPVDKKKTENLRKMLKENSEFQSDDLETLIKNWKEETESKSSLELLRNLSVSQSPFREEDIEKIRNRDPNDKEVVQVCYNLINDRENIRLVLKNVVQNPDRVDPTWVLWHLSKSLLAVCCDRECRGEDKFRSISDKKLANIKYDLDYLVLLTFADAIASRETKGEQAYYRRWMFGDASKPLIRSYEKEQIMHKFRQMSKVAIYVTEQLDGYTCALDPWSRGVLKIQDLEELPASVFISYETKRHLEFFHGSTWKHTVEILTGYSATELQEFGGVVFVDTRTLDTLFEPLI